MQIAFRRHSVFLLAVPLLGAAGSAFAAGCSDSDSANAADADTFDAVPTDTGGGGPFDASDAADAADAAPCANDLAKDGLPTHLSCAGLYTDIAAKTVAPENVAYTPGVQFWSDGAVKSRWLYLPPGAQIDITNFDDWSFPVGTRVFKEFIVDGVRLETRLYEKLTTGFQHTTYRWNAAGTEATREDEGESVPREAGSPYEIPASSDCTQCHQGRTDSLLGVEAVSLGMPGAVGITLATLAADNRFKTTPPVTSITIPDDQNGTAAPALGWLHANCGACHTNNGSSMTTFQARLTVAQLVPATGTATVESLDAYTTAVNMPSARGDGAGGYVPFIMGGSPTNSLVSILSGQRVPDNEPPSAGDQMPPLVSRRVDTVGHAELDAWITLLP